MATVKLKGSELNLSSASNVNFATLVRVVNNKTTIQVIIHADKDGAVVGNFTMLPNSVELVEKRSTDTLSGAATSLAVKVAYTK